MWNEITYPFINFNGSSVDVSEWISNFIPHFSGHVITLWVESTGDRWFLPSKAQYCGAFMLSISPNVIIKRWRGLRKQKNHFYFFNWATPREGRAALYGETDIWKITVNYIHSAYGNVFQNLKSHMYYWPGCEARIRGLSPALCKPYKGGLTVGNFTVAIRDALESLRTGTIQFACKSWTDNLVDNQMYNICVLILCTFLISIVRLWINIHIWICICIDVQANMLPAPFISTAIRAWMNNCNKCFSA